MWLLLEVSDDRCRLQERTTGSSRPGTIFAQWNHDSEKPQREHFYIPNFSIFLISMCVVGAHVCIWVWMPVWSKEDVMGLFLSFFTPSWTWSPPSWLVWLAGQWGLQDQPASIPPWSYRHTQCGHTQFLPWCIANNLTHWAISSAPYLT